MHNSMNNMQLSNVSYSQVELIKTFLKQFENVQIITSPAKKPLLFKKINEKTPKTINEINSKKVTNEQINEIQEKRAKTEQLNAKYIENNQYQFLLKNMKQNEEEKQNILNKVKQMENQAQIAIQLHLEEMPDKTAEKLLNTVQQMIPQTGKATIQGSNIVIHTNKIDLENIQMNIKRIKINGTEIETSVGSVKQAEFRENINQGTTQNIEQYILTLQLQYLPESTAENLEIILKPKMTHCDFEILPKGDLSIKCSKDKLEEVKKTIATVKVNSVALKFTEKALK
ncbi:Hypothetical_protein [Hexamita inflata]|uniref:Hypothetical_protein n=1 Tax=Hexamita inflata TaxID=28002 RepID=A0AA86PK50_9EUKA|nr:Hypothetical protein HINF_LOCUS24637 [Hexamita inflata]